MILKLIKDLYNNIDESYDLTESAKPIRDMYFEDFIDAFIELMVNKNGCLVYPDTRNNLIKQVSNCIDSWYGVESSGYLIPGAHVEKIGKTFYNINMLDKIFDLNRFKRLKKTLDVKEFCSFMNGYQRDLDRTAKEIAKEAERKERAANKRSCKDAIKNSYKGDIDALIMWLKDNVTEIAISIPVAKDEDLDKKAFKDNDLSLYELKNNIINNVEEFKDELQEKGQVAANFKLEEKPGQLYSNWVVKLNPKAIVPDDVKNWMFPKRLNGKNIITDSEECTDVEELYAEGNVYRENANMLTGNPIAKDLLFNYGFKLGKQK